MTPSSTANNDMPHNWTVTTLGQISNILMGQSPPGETYNSEGLGKPLINGPAEYGNISPRPLQWTTEPTKLCKVNDILFCVRGNTIGRINIADQEYCIGRGVAAIRGKAFQGETLFIRYWLEYKQPLLYRIAASGGSTFPNITGNQLNELSIILPPLPEQRAIAHILQTVQNAIQARCKELELERERKAALMEHLFTHGTRGEATKQTEIGKIPESWVITKFAEAVNIANGQVNPTEEPYRTMRHVGPENIAPDTGVLLETKTNEQLNIISGNYYFTPEDVLYSKIRPYLNKVALPLFEGTCSADMYPLRPNENYFTREFLYHLMLSERVKKQTTASQARTGIPKINREQLGSISLLRPPLSEQREIATILGAMSSKITTLEKEISLQVELFRTLLEELMSGRLSALPLVEEG